MPKRLDRYDLREILETLLLVRLRYFNSRQDQIYIADWYSDRIEELWEQYDETVLQELSDNNSCRNSS